MATYNSEKFIKAQIQSVIDQSSYDWMLFIRDDGSKDHTLQILNRFIEDDTRIVLLEDNKTNLGAALSFMTLLAQVDAENYFFCDHDDVWDKLKVEKSLKAMKDLSLKFPNKPLIVHTDLYVVDEHLQIISNSFWKSSGIKPTVLSNKNIIQVFNCVTGCTMIFNKAAKVCSLPYNSAAPMHDWWIAIKTLMNDGIIYGIDEPLIYYRQHQSNEVGARNVNSTYFIKKILHIKNTLNMQWAQIKFLRRIRGIGAIRYYYYKIYYTLIRKI